MRRTVVWALALLVLGPPLGARDKPQDQPDRAKSPAQQYQALVKEYNAAQMELAKAYRAAKTDEERKKLFEEKNPATRFAPRFLKLAEEHPGDRVAFDALEWVAMRGGKDASVPRALDLLRKDYAGSPKLGPLCQTLRYAEAPAGDDFLRAVMDKNPSHELKGQATYSLAFRLHLRADRPAVAGKPEGTKLLRQAEDLFERVVRDYGDVESYRGTLTDAAWGDLYEIHHLEVGMKAPDIEGEDLDGKSFKLSDYRGKVVVLDFWGNW